MEVDDDDAVQLARQQGELPPKDQTVTQILVQIPLRAFQQSEREREWMKESKYYYCIQFEDTLATNQGEWVVYKKARQLRNF